MDIIISLFSLIAVKLVFPFLFIVFLGWVLK